MNNNRKIAVYAGSFDCLTNGHMHIITESLPLFDLLYVAIGINPNKKCTFSMEQRESMIRKALSEVIDDTSTLVIVSSFENKYLVDYAKEIGATHMIRGVRSSADFEYERTMRHVNQEISGNADIKTIFMIPPRDLMDVSSSFVKALVGPKGWQENVKRYLPLPIAKDFIEHYERKTL